MAKKCGIRRRTRLRRKAALRDEFFNKAHEERWNRRNASELEMRSGRHKWRWQSMFARS